MVWKIWKIWLATSRETVTRSHCTVEQSLWGIVFEMRCENSATFNKKKTVQFVQVQLKHKHAQAAGCNVSVCWKVPTHKRLCWSHCENTVEICATAAPTPIPWAGATVHSFAWCFGGFQSSSLQRFHVFLKTSPLNSVVRRLIVEIQSIQQSCKVTFPRQKEKKDPPLLELLPSRHKKIHSHPPFLSLLLFFCHWAQGDRHKTITDTQTHTERNPCAHLCKHVHWQLHTSTCSLQRSDKPVILLPKGK